MTTASLHDVVETLRTNVETNKFVDVGKGAAALLNTSQDRLRVALAVLKEEGFAVHMVIAKHQDPKVDLKTTVKVLAPVGTSYRDVVQNKQKISPIQKEDSNA